MNFLNKYVVLGLVLILLAFCVKAVEINGLEQNLEGDCFEAALTDFSLENDSVEEKEYKVSAIGANKEWVNLNGRWIGQGSSLVFFLPGEEEEDLYAFIKPPCNTEPGVYRITLKIQEGTQATEKTIMFTVLESRKVILEVVGASEHTVGQCQSAEYDLNIVNDGKADELIEVVVKDLSEKWVVGTGEFLLEKNQSIDKKIVVLPKCNARVQEYNFTIVARIKETNFEDEANALLRIVDEQEIEINASNFTICNDLVEEHTFTVKNNGVQRDELKVYVLGMTKEFSLNSGEEKGVKLTFNEAKELVGDENFTIKVSSKKFAKRTEKTLTFTRENCYDLGYTLPPSTSMRVTSGEEKVVKVKVKNTGTKSNEAEFGIENLEWIQLVPEKATLTAGEEKEFYVYLNPPLDLDTGRYEEKITLSGQDFEQHKHVSIQVTGVLEEETDRGLTVEGELKETSTENQVTINVSIQNDSNSNMFVKSIQALDFNVEFEPQEFLVDKNSSKEIEMTLMLEQEMSAVLNIPLILRTEDGRIIEKEIEVNLQQGTDATAFMAMIVNANTAVLAGSIAAVIIAIALVLFYLMKKGKKKGKK